VQIQIYERADSRLRKLTISIKLKERQLERLLVQKEEVQRGAHLEPLETNAYCAGDEIMPVLLA